MKSKYNEIYQESLNKPEEFWKNISEDIFWFKKPSKILSKSKAPFYKWFEDGVTNTCYNALDYHIDQGKGEKIALIYDSPITGNKAKFTFNKLREKVFGIENNLDELGGIDFKKGCYVGQENTSRIKLRNKLRRRILPIQKIEGEIFENDIIKYKSNEIGKVMINKPFTFALIKIVDPDLKEFNNKELTCGKSKVKVSKPHWM